MMENQHRSIKGYRELTQAEIDLMNRIKAQGALLEQLVADVRAHIDQQMVDSEGDYDEIARIIEANSDRWVEIAMTDLQTGLMALTRAVAQPTTF
jgi:hypothetical protein